MHVGKARELANASGIHVCDGLVLSQEIFCELHSGNLDAAEGPLKEMDLATERLGGIHRSQYEFLFAGFKFLLGDLQQAFEHMHRANSIVATVGSPMFVDGITQILTANILFGLAREAEATRYYNRAMEIAEQMQSDPLRFGVYLLMAQMAFNREDEAAGLDALRRRAGDAGKPGGCCSIPVQACRGMPWLNSAPRRWQPVLWCHLCIG